MTGCTATVDWHDEVTAALAALTGLDLGGTDDGHRYAAVYCCHDLGYEMFDEVFDPALLGAVLAPPFTAWPALGDLLEGWDELAPGWTLDLGASLFVADETDGWGPAAPRDLPLRATGAELARVLTARCLRPTVLDGGPHVELRLHTDGTALDALRTVTGLHRGRAHLLDVDPDPAVEPRWAAALGTVADPALRAHLSHLSLTEQWARGEGARFLGGRAPGVVEHPGTVVAGWSLGEGQGWYAVVRLP